MSNSDDLWVLQLGSSRRASKKQHIKTAKKKIQNYIKSAPEVMVKITSFCKDASTITDHLSYLCRNDDPIYNSYDVDVSEERESGEITEELSEIKGRKTCNMILSMPHGTIKEGFREATKEFLKEEFGNHDYHYVFHDNKDHYHAHVVVPMVDRDLKRINPRKDDIQRWRETFSNELEKEGIEANAMKCISKGKYPKNKNYFQEMKKKATLFEHGEAPYDNDPNNTKSYFVTLDMGGVKKTYWGVGLKSAMKDSGVKIGDNVQLEKAEDKKVETKTPVTKDDKNVGKETVRKKRNEWIVNSQKEATEQPAAEIKGDLRRSTLASWKSLFTEMVNNKDMETAKQINKIVKEQFQTSFSVAKEIKPEREDRTR